MSKIKKFLIAILAAMMLASTVGLIACGGEDALSIKTKESKVKYYIGYNVDMFDFFVQEGGVRYAFTVTKTGEEESVATGRHFFVDEAGEYTAICTATRGEQSVTKDYTFVVYDTVPYMLLTKNNVVVNWRSKDSLNNIFTYAQPRVITESAYEQVIDYVLVYDNADGSARRIDLTVGNPSSDGMWDGKRLFTFSFEGNYEFHLQALSSGGKTEEMLKVTAAENYSEYPELSATLTVDEINRTASWSAVSGAALYRVKIGAKSLVTDKTSLDLAPYMDKQFNRFDLAVIAVTADDEVIGKKVQKDVAINPEGYEGIVISSGARVDLTKNEVNIIPTFTQLHDVRYTSKVDVHYLAYRGNYGIGYFVDFYFTGNNLPQVCLFSNDMDTNITNSEGGKGILIMNGMGSGHTPDLLYDRLRALGPDRMSGPYNGENLFVLTAAAGYEQLTKTYLSKSENENKRYRYVVGTEESPSGTIIVVIQLWSAPENGEEELVYLANKDTGITVDELPAGNIVAYGAVAGSTVDTTFNFCKKPYSYSADGIKSSGAIFASNGEIMLSGKVLGSSAQPFTVIPSATNPKGETLGMSNSFVGLDKDYGVGTYIDINFKGNNMPEVMFFADNINGNMSGYSAYLHSADTGYLGTASGEKGLVISNGMIGSQSTNALANDINEYFTIWGPNRIYMGEDVSFNATFKSCVKYALASITEDDANFGMLVQSNLAKEEYKNTEFKYTVGTFDLTGKLGIHIKLYKVEGSNETLILEYIKDTVIDTADIEAGGIVMYGTVKGDNELTKFSYSEPYTSAPEAVYSDGTVASDGTITLAGRHLGSSAQPFAVIANAYTSTGDYTGMNNSYYAMLGNYGVGTYVDLEFIGNNMPEVMFFADKINGNMSGYSSYDGRVGTNGVASGEKGVLISNGMIGSQSTNPLANDINEYFTVWGPNRIYMGESTALNGAFSGYTNKALISIKETDASFGGLAQSKLEAGVNYKATVGTFNLSGNLGIHVKLVKLEGGAETVVAELVRGTSVEISQISAGSIVLYGSVTGADNTTEFKVSEPYQSKPAYIASGATVAEDGTITTTGKTVTASGQLFGLVPGYAGYSPISYYAIQGEYGVGTYIDLTFKGNNMPEVMFFADKINDSMTGYKDYASKAATFTGEKGLLISNGLAEPAAAANDINEYFTVWGPNKMVYMNADGTVNTTDISGTMSSKVSQALINIKDTDANYGGLVQTKLEEDTEYRATVGTFDLSGLLGIHVKLVKIENTVETVVAELISGTSLDVSAVSAGNIVLYDTIKGSDTKFKVSEPYQSEPEEIPPVVNGATIVPDGTITTTGRTVTASGQLFGFIPGYTANSGNTSYYAIQGKFGVGTYVDLSFTGNNMPEVMFFVDNINGNLTGYKDYSTKVASGEKGLLISNGLAEPNNPSNDIDNYFTVWGPNRMVYKNTDGTISNTVSGTMSGKVSQALISIKDTDTTYGGLVQTKLDDSTEYKASVGTYELSGNLGIHVKLVKIENTVETLVAELISSTSVEASAISAGNIVLYDTVKGSNTVFKVSEPYKSKPDYYPPVLSGTTVASDGTVTTTGRVIDSSAQPFGIIPGAQTSSGAPAGFGTSYYATQSKHGVGTYIDLTFKGNNMPEIMFFADKINDNMTGYSSSKGGVGVASGEKGLLISNGMKGANTSNDIEEYFTVWGPNRIYFDSTTTSGTFKSFRTKALICIEDTDTAYGKLVQTKLDAQTNYKAVVGTYDDNGKLGIHVKLYTTDGSEQLVAELKKATTLDTSTITAGHIVLYDTFKGVGDSTVFKVSEPYTLAE